ncbi:hypothetical protein QN277_006185 [Acacia crassicarpa]|uniref:Uncharacterized protein n=1 Tax=Acacia crassicarpa TaxID=499986 RepID=A0AAE1MAH6_9FABA|nr:hypothetical protein QN277_006185 [Acacia crassicarpa]
MGLSVFCFWYALSLSPSSSHSLQFLVTTRPLPSVPKPLPSDLLPAPCRTHSSESTVLRALIGEGQRQSSTRGSSESRREEGRRIGAPSLAPSPPHLRGPPVSKKARDLASFLPNELPFHSRLPPLDGLMLKT